MFSAERISLQKRVALVAAAQNLLVEWEGVEFVPQLGVPWISVIIVASPDSRFSTIGSPNWIRRKNILQININTAANNGAKANEVFADALCAPFVGTIQDSGGPVINFYPPSLKPSGSRNGYYTSILSIPYQVDFPQA